MSRTGYKRYTCAKCGKTFELATPPNFCQNCGSADMGANPQAVAYAKSQVAKIREIAPKAEAAWAEYVTLRAQYDQIRMILGAYVNRGIIKREEIPNIKKIKLSDALAARREELREQEEK